MMKNLLFLSSAFLISAISLAQNVGINATGAAPANAAMLDIVASDKGLLIPRVALTNVTTYAPLTGTAVDGLIVYSTSTPTGGNGSGFYYWSTTSAKWINLVDNLTPGAPWYTNGNAATIASSAAYGTAVNNNFLGTTDNVSLVVATNNLERARFLGTGEIVFGASTTTIPDDFFSAVSNTTLDWAVNGYSSFNGSGVYGQLVSGTSIFGGVQGEYYGTNAQGCGVRGINGGTTKGTAFNAVSSGVNGNGPNTAGTLGFAFGVFGANGSTSGNVTGGVIGIDATFARGMLGYYASTNIDYSVYGMTAAGNIAAGNVGKMMNPHSNEEIALNEDHGVGLGIYGGVMGGWIKGNVYGTHLSGVRYGVYSDGASMSNTSFTQLNTLGNGERVASFAVTSLTNDLTVKGKSNLTNGKCLIPFDEKISELIDMDNLVVTVSSLEDCRGVYVAEIKKEGIVIKEMQGGTSNSKINFIMVATMKNKNTTVSSEILSRTFEENMKGVVHHEEDTTTEAKAIWWDGTQVRFDTPNTDWRSGTVSPVDLLRRK